MSKLRRHLHHAVWLACCLAGPPGCDPCESPPDLPTNQDPASLAPCPSLPAGVEPIEGLFTGHATERFDGLTLTLSTRPLACGETAAQHEYCGDDERGVTIGFPAEQAVPGSHFIKHPVHVEFEAPGITSVGGGGSIREAQVELFEITEACVTGRIVGFTDVGGPFDGGIPGPEVHAMKNDDPRLTRLGALLLGLAALVACDQPECIDGPSNLTPEAVAACAAPPAGTSPEDEIVSASAELREDGTLVLTWSSFGLQCGTSADEVPLPESCETRGWAISAELPPALAVPGVIDLSEHPELQGSFTVIHDGDGVSSRPNEERWYVGAIELVAVGDACVTGVLHGFGTGDPDPKLGGPELDGSFVAPRC